MSLEKNYCIKLLLHDYFQDHRALGRAFVNNKINSVHDLMLHISKVYQISNFYLKLDDNTYLAEAEDVRVIQPFETIRVIQKTDALEDLPKPKVKKNKKKRKISESLGVENEEAVDDKVTKKSRVESFQPIASSSAKRKDKAKNQSSDIVEKNISYFENLNKSNESPSPPDKPDLEIAVDTQDKKQFMNKLDKIIANKNDQVTPLTSSPGKLKKMKSATDYASNILTKKLFDPNIKDPNIYFNIEASPQKKSKKTASTSKTPAKIKEISKLKKEKKLSTILKDTPRPDNKIKNTKLIQTFTPARCILPSDKIEKKINIITNIITKTAVDELIPIKENGHIDNKEESMELDNTLASKNYNSSGTGKLTSLINAISENKDVSCQDLSETKSEMKLLNTNNQITLEATSNNVSKAICEEPSVLNIDDTASGSAKAETIIVQTENVQHLQVIFTDETHINPENTTVLFDDKISTSSSTNDENTHKNQMLTSKKSIGSIGNLLMSLKKTSDAAVSDTTNVFQDDFVTRRKRTRTRQRKTKKVVEHKDSPMPKFVIAPKLNIAAQPHVHKFFYDLEEDMNEKTDEESNPENTVDKIEANSTMDKNNAEESNSNVEMTAEVTGSDNMTQRIEVEEAPHAATTQVNEKRIHNLVKNIKEDMLKQCLLMDKLHPRENDVIAFQILKLNSNFCPEPSKYIVALVKKFDNIAQKIHLQIYDGLSEFQMPEGSLTISDEDLYNTLYNPTALQVLPWSDLIQPRLLFP